MYNVVQTLVLPLAQVVDALLFLYNHMSTIWLQRVHAVLGSDGVVDDKSCQHFNDKPNTKQGMEPSDSRLLESVTMRTHRTTSGCSCRNSDGDGWHIHLHLLSSHAMSSDHTVDKQVASAGHSACPWT